MIPRRRPGNQPSRRRSDAQAKDADPSTPRPHAGVPAGRRSDGARTRRRRPAVSPGRQRGRQRPDHLSRVQTRPASRRPVPRLGAVLSPRRSAKPPRSDLHAHPPRTSAEPPSRNLRAHPSSRGAEPALGFECDPDGAPCARTHPQRRRVTLVRSGVRAGRITRERLGVIQLRERRQPRSPGRLRERLRLGSDVSRRGEHARRAHRLRRSSRR